jgi:hypothetical protein
MEEKPIYNEDSIKSISRQEWYDLRLFRQAEIDHLYVIMGSLQEYFGGNELHEEVVDAYFVDEARQALFFKGVCEAYLAAEGLDNDVELVKFETGHSHVVSKQVCARLKEHYVVPNVGWLRNNLFGLGADDDLYKDPEALYGNRGHWFNFKRYSYLLGVMIKNRLAKQPAINFANAGHKAQLTIDILKEFSAFGDESFKVEYYFNEPHVTRITMSEGNPIWSEIAKYEKSILGDEGIMEA